MRRDEEPSESLLLRDPLLESGWIASSIQPVNPHRPLHLAGRRESESVSSVSSAFEWISAGVLPVRRRALLYTERAGSSVSCDHLRGEDGREEVDCDELEALRLPGKEEWDRDCFAEEVGVDGGRSDAGAKDRVSTESR